MKVESQKTLKILNLNSTKSQAFTQSQKFDKITSQNLKPSSNPTLLDNRFPSTY